MRNTCSGMVPSYSLASSEYVVRLASTKQMRTRKGVKAWKSSIRDTKKSSFFVEIIALEHSVSELILLKIREIFSISSFDPLKVSNTYKSLGMTLFLHTL